jgi:hypothetical protein
MITLILAETCGFNKDNISRFFETGEEELEKKTHQDDRVLKVMRKDFAWFSRADRHRCFKRETELSAMTSVELITLVLCMSAGETSAVPRRSGRWRMFRKC